MQVLNFTIMNIFIEINREKLALCINVFKIGA